MVQGSVPRNYEDMGFSKSGCDLSSGLSFIFEALSNTIKGRLRGLGRLSLINLMVSVDVKHHVYFLTGMSLLSAG